jgi:membrane peptidoglycan carboxypeptidase
MTAYLRRLRGFDRRWLILIPTLFIVWLLALYMSIVIGFTAPSQIILGAKGLEVMDRNGEVFFVFSDEPGSSRIIPLDEISPHLINATIATEDADYWSNPGVNVKGLARAAYENIAFWENGGLFKGSGGSSLTQQLAKNLYIAPEERAKRSPLRKIKETLVAFELNRRYSKEQILEWYVSNTFYGHGAYGVESASYRYFNKAPIDLTLAEAALLAGIPRAPAVYDPVTDFDAAIGRQKQVIGLMVRHDVISQEEADAALAEPIVLREGRSPGDPDTTETTAPHFAYYVRDLLPQLIGKEQAEGQLRVTTTLDLTMQEKAEDVVTTNLDRLEPQVGASNGALVAIDPRTGEVLAMVGSHDFNREDISGQVNNALTLNQPGSTMKPITYLSAFMKGWSPSTIIVDEPMRISDVESSYVLNNADGRYRGAVQARVALGSSLNVPAVKALEFAGLESVYSLAKRMGLSTLKEISAYGPAFTLGGADVTLLDMTYAFSVFANQGEQAGMGSVQDLPQGSRPLDPIAVLKIETVDGRVLWQAKQRKERIVPANLVAQITNILADDSARVSMFGANSPLNLRGRPAAVKSGLSDNARDAWAIGYTPQLVTGIWVGNANNAPMPGATSTFTAAPIWQSFMTVALQGQPVVGFQAPQPSESERTRSGGLLTPEPTERPRNRDATPTPRGVNSTPTPQQSPTPTRTPQATPTRQPPRNQDPDPTSTPRRSGQATPTPNDDDEDED